MINQPNIKIALIVAAAENNVIGKDNKMPWRLSSDLKYFRRVTMGKPVIMGRKTFSSIGKPLDGRANIIITRDKSFKADGCIIAHSINEAIDQAMKEAEKTEAKEVMIIGGGEIYRQSLARADKIYMTHVHTNPEGDAFFPKFDEATWKQTSSQFQKAGEKDSADVTFAVYEKQ